VAPTNARELVTNCGEIDSSVLEEDLGYPPEIEKCALER
jgi:hypothetical protein